MRLHINHELISAQHRIGSSTVQRRLPGHGVKATTPGVIERPQGGSSPLSAGPVLAQGQTKAGGTHGPLGPYLRDDTAVESGIGQWHVLVRTASLQDQGQ